MIMRFLFCAVALVCFTAIHMVSVSAAVPAWFGSLPATFDMRNTTCYKDAVLDQGICGSCYCHSASTVMSIARCNALGVVRPADNAVVSSQFTTAIAATMGGRTYPCAGGNTLADVYNPWANYVMNNAGSSNTLLTCSNNCTYGCDPYALGVCPESASTYATGVSAGAYPTYCSSSSSSNIWSTTTCPQSTAGSVPPLTSNFTDPTWAWSTAGQIPIEWNGTAWSNITLANIMTAVNETGAVSLSIDACMEWQAWAQERCPTGTTLCNSGCFTELGIPVTGIGMMCYSWQPFAEQGASQSVNGKTLYYLVLTSSGPINTKDAFTGASCSCNSSYSGHMVTIVGWLDAAPNTGRPAFIVQNSWGTVFGDNGYFYLDMLTFSDWASPTGSIFPIEVYRMKMVPRSSLSTNSLEDRVPNSPPTFVERCVSSMDPTSSNLATGRAVSKTTGKIERTMHLQKTGGMAQLKTSEPHYHLVRNSVAHALGKMHGKAYVPVGASSITTQVVSRGYAYRGTIDLRDVQTGAVYQSAFSARHTVGKASSLNGGVVVTAETTTPLASNSGQQSSAFSASHVSNVVFVLTGMMMAILLALQ